MLRRHPAGLYVLFFTELWERFGFYCMAAIFAFYMRDKGNGHEFLQKNWADILGWYLGLVYFTPFFGGIIADRWLGYRNCIYLGGAFLALGYFLLAVPPLPAFFAGLGCIVIGNGLFKPNISTLVGKQYPAGDPRLDSAYTIFYMGINIGAFISPLVAAVLIREFHRDNFDGYYAAFAGAGAGMVISVLTFWLFRRGLSGEDAPTASGKASTEPPVPPDVQRQRHIALLIIFGCVILFWMAFKQNAGTFNFWFEHQTQRTPVSWLRSLLDALYLDRLLLDGDGQFSKTLQSSINPFFVIVFSPLVVVFWLALRARGLEPSTPGKIALGMLLAAGAFGIMMLGALASNERIVTDPATGREILQADRVSGWYLISAYAVLTLGELCLSPMGLSLVSKLAAPTQRSMWMGGWFVVTAIGGYLSSAGIGRFWDDKQWPHVLIPHGRFFLVLICSSLFAFGLLMLFYRRVNAAMPGRK